MDMSGDDVRERCRRGLGSQMLGNERRGWPSRLARGGGVLSNRRKGDELLGTELPDFEPARRDQGGHAWPRYVESLSGLRFRDETSPFRILFGDVHGDHADLGDMAEPRRGGARFQQVERLQFQNLAGTLQGLIPRPPAGGDSGYPLLTGRESLCRQSVNLFAALRDGVM